MDNRFSLDCPRPFIPPMGGVLHVPRIEAVTVCVDFSKFLELAAPSNKRCFNRWMIVTVERDEATIDVCERLNLEYCFTDRLYEDGAKFAKGKAINDGFSRLDCKDWMAHVDADTILLQEGFKQAIKVPLNTMSLYSVHGRLLLNSLRELQEFYASVGNTYDTSQMTHVDWFVGYFQLWHSSYCSKYPEVSDTAGLDDNILASLFSYKDSLKTYCLHLGEIFKHHNGVESEADFDSFFDSTNAPANS